MQPDKKQALLIDDDFIVNKINKYLIDSMHVFDSIEMKSTPAEALDFLKEKLVNNEALPGLILVDISMPEMDGFEFIDVIDELLEEYKIQEAPLFALLSGSNYKRDHEQFEKTPIVKKFLSKPLQKEDLEKLLNDFSFIA